MELSRAISQISEIHGYLARSEVYRGYRPIPVALSGICAFLAAILEQPLVGAGASVPRLIGYWLAVAVLSATVSSVEVALAYAREDDYARRQTRRVAAQFVPCLIAGGAFTVAALRLGTVALPWLPGTWALVFGLGIFASRPYLPHAIGWVALFYLLAGAALLASAPEGPLGWQVAAVFGPGQLGAALVLHRNRARSSHGD